jgi:hypothetical protein
MPWCAITLHRHEYGHNRCDHVNPSGRRVSFGAARFSAPGYLVGRAGPVDQVDRAFRRVPVRRLRHPLRPGRVDRRRQVLRRPRLGRRRHLDPRRRRPRQPRLRRLGRRHRLGRQARQCLRRRLRCRLVCRRSCDLPPVSHRTVRSSHQATRRTRASRSDSVPSCLLDPRTVSLKPPVPVLPGLRVLPTPAPPSKPSERERRLSGRRDNVRRTRPSASWRQRRRLASPPLSPC